jgi:acetyl esterase/lipase
MRRRRRATLSTTAALLGALNSVNALRPLGWGRDELALPSWGAGLVTSELPLQTIGWQALGAWSMRGSGTNAARAMTAASWAALAGIELRARQAPGVLERALAETFGADYRERARHPRPSPERLPGLLGTALAHRRYTGDSRDLSYGPAGRRNQLDLWRRADLPRDAGAPVLIQIHGGGWVSGDRTGQGHPLMVLMAELGWVCASISYRLSPRATWPAQLDDVRAAVAWVKRHGGEHGGDPGFVAVTGGSAGGHLSMLAALDPDCELQAAVPFYGPPDWTNRAAYRRDLIVRHVAAKVIKQPLEAARELYEQASPIDQVHADAPPFFVLQGTNDNLVNPADQRAFVQALRRVSRRPVAYAELPGAFHAFDLFASTRARAAAAAVADFLGLLWAGR